MRVGENHVHHPPWAAWRTKMGYPRNKSIYIHCRQQKKDDPESTFDEANLVHVIYDLFTAGTDTGSSTLCWALLFMVVYPDIQGESRDVNALEMFRSRGSLCSIWAPEKRKRAMAQIKYSFFNVGCVWENPHIHCWFEKFRSISVHPHQHVTARATHCIFWYKVLSWWHHRFSVCLSAPVIWNSIWCPWSPYCITVKMCIFGEIYTVSLFFPVFRSLYFCASLQIPLPAPRS